MKLDSYNTILTTIFTIVATIATIRSCQIARDVASDERQLAALDSLAKTQQNQLNTQRTELSEIKNQTEIFTSELSEMKGQSKIISEEYSEIKHVDEGISSQTDKISKQLEYSQKEQDEKKHQQLLVMKAELIELRAEVRKILDMNAYGNMDSGAFKSHSSYIRQAQAFLDNESKYQILLEDSVIFYTWTHFAYWAESFANDYNTTKSDSDKWIFFCKSRYDTPVISSFDTTGIKIRNEKITKCIQRYYIKESEKETEDFVKFYSAFTEFLESKLGDFIQKKLKENHII